MIYYTRGAHFKKKFVRLSWLIDILYKFSWGFQKYNFFQDWIHPIDAQLLLGLPAQFWWATRLGRAWASIGCVQSWKKLYFWNPHEKLYKISIGQLNRTKFFLKWAPLLHYFQLISILLFSIFLRVLYLTLLEAPFSAFSNWNESHQMKFYLVLEIKLTHFSHLLSLLSIWCYFHCLGLFSLILMRHLSMAGRK